MNAMETTSKAALLASLRGQELKVQGLRSAFAAWPFAVNPALEEVRVDVKESLNKSIIVRRDQHDKSPDCITGYSPSILNYKAYRPATLRYSVQRGGRMPASRDFVW